MGTGTLNPISASYTPSGKHTLCHVFFPWCTTDPKAMEPCDRDWKFWNCELKQTFILLPFLLFLLFLRQVSCILGCFLARFVAKNKLWSCNLSTSMSQMHDYRDMPPCLVCVVVVVVVIKPRDLHLLANHSAYWDTSQPLLSLAKVDYLRHFVSAPEATPLDLSDIVLLGVPAIGFFCSDLD